MFRAIILHPASRRRLTALRARSQPQGRFSWWAPELSFFPYSIPVRAQLLPAFLSYAGVGLGFAGLAILNLASGALRPGNQACRAVHQQLGL